MSSLKSLLRGETMPEFRLTLPPGWVRHTPTSDGRDQLLAAARARLMQANRPDLYGELMSMTQKAFDDMRRLETLAYFVPGPETPENLYLPISLTASIRRSTDGVSLDSTVVNLIRTKGAQRLGADRRFVRWEERGTQEVGGESARTDTVFYLTPVPGSGHKRALLFTLVLPRESDEAEDEELADDVKTLFDACVSTFQWIAP